MLQNTTALIISGGIANLRRTFHFLNPVLSLLLVSLGLLTSPTAFAHRDVFTNTYTLGTTKPLQFEAIPPFLQISSTASYTLTVQNGAADGSNRISRGEIQFGTTVIIADTELTAQTGTISKAVHAPPPDYFNIILKDGLPGAFIKVTLTRHIPDTTAPVILLSSPSAEQLFTSTPISLFGNGYDLLDGSTTAYYGELTEARLNGGAPVKPTPNGAYSFSLALTPGANSFTLTLKDYEGNASTVTRRVWLDSTPPQVTVTSPTAGATVTSAALTVTGTASDDTSVTGVKVNGAAATLSGNTFTANVTLSAGANTLTVVATDRAARITTVTRTVTYNAAPPLPSVSAVIGLAGGTVALPDGMRVEVPAGALVADVRISLAEIPLPAEALLPPDTALAGKVYSLTPDGQVFLKPVAITLPYNLALLPPGYEEGGIAIHRLEPARGNFLLEVPSEIGEEDAESNIQIFDTVAKRITAYSSHFSVYAAVGLASITGFAPVQESVTGAEITLYRPGSPGQLRTDAAASNRCAGGNSTQTILPSRIDAAIATIVLHSTNNTNTTRTFNRELGWATDTCNAFFAHYYINRDGLIYQVAADTTAVQHTRPSATLGINNGNAIGIELFNNVGEPYDGRQIAALLRLLDFLGLKYGIPRPQRNPASGVLTRNVSSILAGGDRIVSHYETDPRKRDPIGIFRSAGTIDYIGTPGGAVEPPVVLAGGDAGAPPLIDLVVDAWQALDRGRADTGVINTSGGDAYGPALPGNGGAITYTDNVANAGTAPTLSNYTDNTPLIVAAGQTRSLAGAQVFTDAIVAGTLEVIGDLNLRLTGTLYLAPTGRIKLQNGDNGGTFLLVSIGTPLVQGLIESIGKDGPSEPSPGGNGGRVTVTSASSGPVIVPTLITRGGDADTASAGIGKGGSGGPITVQAGTSTQVFLGGGSGLRSGTEAVPPFRSGIASTLPLPPEHLGDRLPPPPPFNLASIGSDWRTAPPRIPLRTAGFQQGFTRGLLTSGGMGGAGTSGAPPNSGGPGGDGGAIILNVGPSGKITFRDTDIITGADVEMTYSDILLPESGPLYNTYFAASGSLGGKGAFSTTRNGGDGGPGGRAGDIRVTGTLDPAPTTFAPVGGPFDLFGNPNGGVIGFNAGPRPRITDDFFSFIIGTTVEASNAARSPSILYRLRLDAAGNTLGGSGGFPSGEISGGFPGLFGPYGNGGVLMGLPH